MKVFIVILLVASTLSTLAQSRMRPVEQLINKADPGWALVKDWIGKAKNKVEVLTCDTNRAKEALYKTQVTTRSSMGAVVYETGGLLVDSGWIRILGSGNVKLNRSLPDWNKGKTFREFGEQSSYLLIADDAVGGFFSLNGGGLGKDAGMVYYLSPDNLEWEPLNLTYTAFLNFYLNGDLAAFYQDTRWKNWGKEVSKLDGNKSYSFYPYLFTKEGKDINKAIRNEVPIDEQYQFTIQMRKQLGLSEPKQ